MRNSLNSQELVQKSASIAKRVFGLNEFKSSRTVMCYMDFRNEVMTAGIIERCLGLGKKVVLPKVLRTEDGTELLVPYEISDLSRDIRTGSYGIEEPAGDVLCKTGYNDIDLVLVPGVAFDCRMHRLGYGAGFYDRFLPKTRNECIKAGLAFEIQMVDNILSEAHDVSMDMVITEDRIIRRPVRIKNEGERAGG
jgi:5-formyltetrahydrofolate cyclo-ligase